MTHISQCDACKRYKGYKDEKPVCSAYPKGIPDVIFYNVVPHNQPLKGDNGKQFKPIKGFLPTFPIKVTQ